MRVKLILSTLLWTLVVANPFSNASAKEVTPSFDCKAATAPAEKLICTDPDRDLQWLDRTMADQFNFRIKGVFSPEAADLLRRNQRDWLQKKDRACGITAATRPNSESERETLRRCLVQAYQRRNRAIMSLPNANASSSPTPDEVLAKLKQAEDSEHSEVCPVSRKFDVSNYLRAVAEGGAANPIFYEIPLGLEVTEDQRDYRPIDVTDELPIPSDNAPKDSANQLNPHHETGDSRLRIYCRIHDKDGKWWLLHKNGVNGAFEYLHAADMSPVEPVIKTSHE